MNDTQIIEAQSIVIEEVKPQAKAHSLPLKSLALSALTGLVTGLLGSLAITQLMPKDDILGKMQLLQKETAGKTEADFNKKLEALQIKFDEQNKANALKLANLETALKNLPEIKEVTKLESSDAIKAQIEGLKADFSKITPKISLFEKEQGTNKSSHSLAMGYIALSNLERGELTSQDIKRLAQTHPAFKDLNSLTDKAIVTPAFLVKTLKTVVLKEVKQEPATGWLDKLKTSAGSLVKISSKDVAKSPQLNELETVVLTKDFAKALQIWEQLKSSIENDKGFETQLQLAKKQTEDIAQIKAILAKMSVEQ